MIKLYDVKTGRTLTYGKGFLNTHTQRHYFPNLTYRGKEDNVDIYDCEFNCWQKLKNSLRLN